MSKRTWPESRRYVIPTVALGLLSLRISRRLGCGVLGLAAGVAAFFRDPERPLTPETGVIYAAADGFIAGVDEAVEEPWLPDGKGTSIRTFLSLHNVHINRSPVAGVVRTQQAVKGGFAPALFGSAGDNSRNRIALDGEAGPVVVVQIAGSLARTISSWVTNGERVEAGQRLGMIHFGSRTDVLLPVGRVEVLVKTGDRVRAGQTPLARYLET